MMFQRDALSPRHGVAATIFVLFAFAAFADEANWVDRYIQGHGACDQPITVYQPQPFGLPLEEWKDDDLLKLKSALERCDAKYQKWAGMPSAWVRPTFNAVVTAVNDRRRYLAQLKAQAEARKFETQQIELARQHQLEAQDHAREVQEKEAIAEKKAADARAAHALAARQEKDRIKEQARLADVQAQAKRDREAADQAKALAEQEAPRIAAIEREASEAQRARFDAERRLEEVRKQASNAEARRDAEDAAVRTAKARRLGAEKLKADREREQHEYEALAKTCAVSAKQFGRVAIGMHLREVRQTFGCLGSLDTSSEFQGLGVFSVYRWDGAQSGTAAVTTFNNDTLVSKTQNSLD